MDIFTKSKLVFLEYSFTRLATYLEVLESPMRERLRVEHSEDHAQKVPDHLEVVDYIEAADFLNQVRQSFLVILLSKFELWLIRDCRIEAKRRGINWTCDRRRSPLDNAKDFYREELDNPFEFGGHEGWEKTTRYYDVRNCIIHRHGSLAGFSDLTIDRRLEGFIKREPGLSVQGLAMEIYIEHDFGRESLGTVHNLLQDMFCSLSS